MISVTRRSVLTRGIATASMEAMAKPLLAVKTGSQGDDLSFVNPELRPTARQLLAQIGSLPELSANTLAVSRKAMTSYAPPPQAIPAFDKRSLPGRAGAPNVTVYVINASSGGNMPAILHTHGGGYVGGSV